jgi:phosphoribosyl-ATP pyrophosphohydrolase/phosphoribosyl-AMP cyclohydrolase
MKVDFTKDNGLVPVIIQDATSSQVLMLGYMNEEALGKNKSRKTRDFFQSIQK